MQKLDNVQANPGETALSMMVLTRPSLDWVAMSTGMGVPARKVDNVAQLEQAIEEVMLVDGLFLIETRV